MVTGAAGRVAKVVRPWLGALVAAALLLGATGTARGEETEPGRNLGVGYKIGNGLGFTGVDVVARYIPYVSIDFQANYVFASVAQPDGTTLSASGFGVAPTVQGHLFPVGHTPYLGLGLVYIRMSADGVTASGPGFLANLGYEWRFASGVGILVGAGMDYLGTVSATNGTTTVSEKGGPLFNLEAGVRYFF